MPHQRGQRHRQLNAFIYLCPYFDSALYWRELILFYAILICRDIPKKRKLLIRWGIVELRGLTTAYLLTNKRPLQTPFEFSFVSVLHSFRALLAARVWAFLSIFAFEGELTGLRAQSICDLGPERKPFVTVSWKHKVFSWKSMLICWSSHQLWMQVCLSLIFFLFGLQ